MEEEKKYLDYQGLQTYHENLLTVLENSEQATAEALDDLDDRLKNIETKNPYSKLEVNNLLEPITDKLNGIEEFAEVNVQSDWSESNSESDAFIKNKPTIPTVNNGNLYLQASGTTKVTFTANQSENSTFNIATGSANGTISVSGVDVSVKGLGSMAYKSSLVASDVTAISTVTVTANRSSSCSITGSSNAGKAQTIIYINGSSSDVIITVPTTYKTPDGAAVELTCHVGGYCEVSYLNIGGTIYVRGL